jgi:type VI secretion system FHA domain protein
LPIEAGKGLFALFLEGAGIPAREFPPDHQSDERVEVLGRVFRELLEGLITMLHARAESQSQTGVSRTVVRATDNNPLKFVPNVEDALRILTEQQHKGFLDPLSAVREAINDLIVHQLAMQVGIRDSLSEALERFNPERFASRFQEGFVFQKRAKCWDHYIKAYPELVEQAIQELFGESFRSSYHELVEKLRSGRHDLQ